MKKIYFFDVDSTLLNHATFTIPDSALKAIAELKKEGNTIVIATGRSFEHAEIYVRQIGASYAITQNGARILQAGKTAADPFFDVHSSPLDKKRLGELFLFMDDKKIPYGINQGLEGYLSEEFPVIVASLESVKMGYQTHTRFFEGQDVYQAWVFFPESEDATLFPEILARFPEYGLVRWHPFAIDILPGNVNKWTGCQWVLEATGFNNKTPLPLATG